jgi:FMN phosphatase YigB (HAD superfamily)
VLRAALVDVGGTLWPEHWPRSTWEAAAKRRLGGRFGISDSEAEGLLAELALRDPDSTPPPLTQDTADLIADALLASGLARLHAADVLEVLDIPAALVTRPFDGVGELLGGLKEGRLRVVIVTSAFFRTGAGMRRDAEQLGFGQWVDDVLSSVDTGVRKPNSSVFQLALDAARSSPHETVMIGDSEEKDILPAKRLGMRTIRVAIEGPVPDHSEATRSSRGSQMRSRADAPWDQNGSASLA